MKSPVTALTDFMINENFILEDDRELYQYGNYILITQTIIWGIFFISGIIFHCFLGTIIFFIFFYPLRIFAGGFHYESAVACNIVSVLLSLLVVLISKLNFIYEGLVLGACIISTIVVLLLAPIGSSNKPLSTADEKSYGKIAKCYVAFESVCVLALLQFGFYELAYFATAAMTIEATFLLLCIKTKYDNS